MSNSSHVLKETGNADLLSKKISTTGNSEPLIETGLELAVITIETPEVSGIGKIALEAGKVYHFNFPQGDIRGIAQKDGNLTLNFENGSTLELEDFRDAILDEEPAQLVFEGSEPNNGLIEFAKTFEEQQAEIEEQIFANNGLRMSDIEPAAGDEAQEQETQEPQTAEEIALNLSEIEPAAGEGSGPLGTPSSEGRGFGFQSSFEAQGVLPISDVGPINPTAQNKRPFYALLYEE